MSDKQPSSQQFAFTTEGKPSLMVATKHQPYPSCRHQMRPQSVYCRYLGRRPHRRTPTPSGQWSLRLSLMWWSQVSRGRRLSNPVLIGSFVSIFYKLKVECGRMSLPLPRVNVLSSPSRWVETNSIANRSPADTALQPTRSIRHPDTV